ncbi:hypothetical protein ACFL96_06260 [Thermoproteota archaeon]
MTKKILHLFICLILVVQLTGCGTLIHPERKGQKSGDIDTQIAILDGLGLLLFIIPGVIAFAVDFSNGTIYLPGTQKGSIDMKDVKQVKFDPNDYTKETIEKIVKEETGCEVDLMQDGIEISELESLDEMKVRFAEISKNRNTRIAFLQVK